MYVIKSYSLSKYLGIPYTEAKEYIDTYFEQYPGVAHWMESIVQQAKEFGFVTTYFGRRRYIPGIYEKNRSLYELAKRIAINTVAQGTAAELMKLGMINVNKALQEKGLDAAILLQIHDELLLSVPQTQLEATQKIVQEVLESVVSWNVPLQVVSRIGDNWDQVSK